uniref:Uncharacterized protein n=1 Tax=Rhizophora mucronata TaxID=61149 RepID=A0A2P2PF56_RHIMU
MVYIVSKLQSKDNNVPKKARIVKCFLVRWENNRNICSSLFIQHIHPDI